MEGKIGFLPSPHFWTGPLHANGTCYGKPICVEGSMETPTLYPGINFWYGDGLCDGYYFEMGGIVFMQHHIPIGIATYKEHTLFLSGHFNQKDGSFYLEDVAASSILDSIKLATKVLS